MNICKGKAHKNNRGRDQENQVSDIKERSFKRIEPDERRKQDEPFGNLRNALIFIFENPIERVQKKRNCKEPKTE